MVEVRPFRGLRYNLDLVGDLSAVICPPYDVISPEEQQLYYRQSSHNVIRLEFGQELPADSEGNNRYTRAAATLQSWLQEGTLRPEERPAFYIFEHRFLYQGGERSRWGLTARVRLEDWSTGNIRPHENIMKGPAIDRLNLLRACSANLSPIMGMVREKRGGLLSLLHEIAASPPSLSATDSYGVTHNVWVVSDEEAVRRISDFFASEVIYIADGHHRYTTSLNYSRELQAKQASFTGEEPYNFIMMSIMDTGDPDLVILPTHRLVRGVSPENIERFRDRLDDCFEITEFPRCPLYLADTLQGWLDVLATSGGEATAFGVYGLDSQRFHLLKVRDKAQLMEWLPRDRTSAWRELDVSLLHHIVLREMLGIDGADKDCLDFTRDGLEAISGVDSGEYQLAFLLNTVPVSSILNIADAGDQMPQKSTYFYPKAPAGLVINPLFGVG